MPYVIRIHNDAGYVVLPHTHAEDENVVVVRGNWYLGAGERFDSSSLQRLEPGAYGFVPRRMSHFAWSESATTIQVHGIGPFSTDWVQAVYDLTASGVAHVTAGGRPGTPVPAAPTGCFTLEVGTTVRTRFGKGRVIGGLCSPSSQLTQYRIQNDDGDHFWATAEKLEKQ
ncbi:MAG: cupin domain-containing protein [Gemmatimonadaceae bacterium]